MSCKELECARRPKPSGKKSERRREKLPNHINHEKNATIKISPFEKKKKPS